MGIGNDPDATFKLSLEMDMGIPEADRPTFTFRYVTGREWKRIATTYDNLSDAENGAIGFDRVLDDIRTVLVGWHNFADRDGNAIEYDPASMDELVNPMEALELARNVLQQMTPTGTELGNSGSPLQSVSEKSATNAAATNATTDLTDIHRLKSNAQYVTAKDAMPASAAG